MKFRPKFGLKSLFVLVTLCCIAAGWYVSLLNWKKERAWLLAELERSDCFQPIAYRAIDLALAQKSRDPFFEGVEKVRLDWRLKLVGEEMCLGAVWIIGEIPKEQEGVLARTEKAYPELLVIDRSRKPITKVAFEDDEQPSQVSK